MIYHPSTPLEAVLTRKKDDSSIYLAGGTEVLRLGGSGEGRNLIDITKVVPSGITVDDGRILIGAMTTLEEIASSPLVPGALRKACLFCSSFEKRNAATIGGNIGARRSDSYLAACLSALEAKILSVTPHGDEEKYVSEYVNTRCRRLITYIAIPEGADAAVERIALTSTSRAAVTGARGERISAYSVSGSPLVSGEEKDVWRNAVYADDITGSAGYKRYIASVLLEGEPE